MKTKEEIKQLLIDADKAGNIIVNTIDGLVGYKASVFLSQPVDGLLYDLNRDEATILTFIDDPKWINDFAVCKVIRLLHQENATLKDRVKVLEKSNPD
jgi:hypothetical protein